MYSRKTFEIVAKDMPLEARGKARLAWRGRGLSRGDRMDAELTAVDGLGRKWIFSGASLLTVLKKMTRVNFYPAAEGVKTLTADPRTSAAELRRLADALELRAIVKPWNE